MTREIRITAQQHSLDPDCYLDPDDPVNAVMAQQIVGIGIEAADARMRAHARERMLNERENSWEMSYAREHGIKPGSVAWNALWQGK